MAVDNRRGACHASPAAACWSQKQLPRYPPLRCGWVCVPRSQINHPQTAKFNNPTFPPLLQPMSPMFGPTGGAALTGRLPSHAQMPQAHHGSWPFNPTTEHQHTHYTCVCPTSTSPQPHTQHPRPAPTCRGIRCIHPPLKRRRFGYTRARLSPRADPEVAQESPSTTCPAFCPDYFSM